MQKKIEKDSDHVQKQQKPVLQKAKPVQRMVIVNHKRPEGGEDTVPDQSLTQDLVYDREYNLYSASERDRNNPQAGFMASYSEVQNAYEQNKDAEEVLSSGSSKIRINSRLSLNWPTLKSFHHRGEDKTWKLSDDYKSNENMIFDGNLNVYSFNGREKNNPQAGLLATYKHINQVYDANKSLSLSPQSRVKINGNLELTWSQVEKIYRENNVLIDFAKNDSSHGGKEFLETGFMSFTAANRERTEDDMANLDPLWHMSGRYAENNYIDFFENLDKKTLTELTHSDRRKQAEKGDKVTYEIFGETFTLMPNSLSIYHTPEDIRNQEGEDAACLWNYKWQSGSGRELVLTPEGKIVTNTYLFGTFNGGQGAVEHLGVDVVPYAMLGSSPKEYLDRQSQKDRNDPIDYEKLYEELKILVSDVLKQKLNNEEIKVNMDGEQVSKVIDNAMSIAYNTQIEEGMTLNEALGKDINYIKASLLAIKQTYIDSQNRSAEEIQAGEDYFNEKILIAINNICSGIEYRDQRFVDAEGKVIEGLIYGRERLHEASGNFDSGLSEIIDHSGEAGKSYVKGLVYNALKKGESILNLGEAFMNFSGLRTGVPNPREGLHNLGEAGQNWVEGDLYASEQTRNAGNSLREGFMEAKEDFSAGTDNFIDGAAYAGSQLMEASGDALDGILYKMLMDGQALGNYFDGAGYAMSKDLHARIIRIKGILDQVNQLIELGKSIPDLATVQLINQMAPPLIAEMKLVFNEVIKEAYKDVLCRLPAAHPLNPSYEEGVFYSYFQN